MRVSFELTPEEYLDYLRLWVRSDPRHLAAIEEDRRRSRAWVSNLAMLLVLQAIVAVGGGVLEAGGPPAFAAAASVVLTGWLAVGMLRRWRRTPEERARAYDR